METRSKNLYQRLEERFHEWALKRVPATDRKSLIALTFVWMGFTIHPANPLIGGLISNKMYLGPALIGGAIGGLMLVINASLSGYIGYKEGYTVTVITRNAFGARGSILPSFIFWAGITGWAGFSIGFVAEFVHRYVGIPAPLISLIVGILFGITAILGIRAIFILGICSAPLLLGFSIYAAGASISDAGGWGKLMSIAPAATGGTMGWAIGMSFSSWINGSSLGADISRYARNPWHVPLAALIGFLVGNTALQICGSLTTYAKGTWDLVVVLEGMGLLFGGFIFYFLANWTSVDNEFYSGGLAVSNMTGMAKVAGTIVSIIIAIIAATSGIYKGLYAYLVFLGVMTPPCIAVVFADYFIVRKYIDSRPYQDIEDITTVVRPTAIIAWAIGAFGDFYLRGSLGEGLPLVGMGIITLNGMVITFVAYIILEFALVKRRMPAEAPGVESAS